MGARGIFSSVLGVVVALVGLSLSAIVSAPVARAVTSPPNARIAILDTGINADHQEFAPGQIVAWKDFTPAGGHDPYDDHGHGTFVASMAAGLNVVPAKTKSLAPGAPLIIGKVLDAGASLVRSQYLADAVRWAVDEQHADIINISIYYFFPIPVNSDPTYAALDYARSKGVLVTVCNGNGFDNGAVIPGAPGWNSTYDNSKSVLAVGASGINGPRMHTDPEVAAQSFHVTGADAFDPHGYFEWAGTSFAAPKVAGFAAQLIDAARDHGRVLNGDALERLVKYSARDTVMPPTFEGYGIIDAAQLPAALAHAANGTVPARPKADVNAIYVDTLMALLKRQSRNVFP
jgi:serine protease AprX